MLKGVLPENAGMYPSSLNFMIYSWQNDVTAKLLQTIEEMFAEFGLSPARGSGSHNNKISNGNYKRVKKNLNKFLIESDKSEFSDVKIESEKNNDDDFFSSKLFVAFVYDPVFLNRGIISINEPSFDFNKEFVLKFYDKFLRRFGKAYITVSSFPASFGPDYYLSSINTVPKGGVLNANKEYTARLNSWKNNIIDKGLCPLDGYFREIHTFNFIVDRHLNRNFKGTKLSMFMERNGTIDAIPNTKNQYLWTIKESNLDLVREEMEESGLILSSPNFSL